MCLQVPDHLHPHVGQLIGQQLDVAIRQGYWAVILNLKPHKDGDSWCVLWGENLQEGVAGFGDTPQGAIYDFEKAMASKKGAS